MNFEEEFEKRCAGLILVEPRDAQPICKFIIFTQTIDDQGDEVRFSTPSRPDEKKVVLALGESTLPHPFHRVLEKPLPLNEDELQVLGVRPAGSENPDGFAIICPLYCG